MMNAHQRAKLLGQPYRGGYEGEGTGGGWGGSDGGPAGGPAVSERSDLADLNATGGTSLTGGNLATGGIGFGFAPGPVTGADALGWSDKVGPDSPADAIIAPLVPTTEQSSSTTVNLGQLFSNVTTAILGILGITSGTPAGVVGGSKSLAAVAASPSSITTTTTTTDTYYASALAAGLGSAAPELFSGAAPGASEAVQAFAGTPEGGMGTTADGAIMGAPVLGFAGAIVNDTPQASAGASVGATPGRGGPLPAGGLRDPYATPGAAAAGAQSAAPLAALAGLAGLIFWS